MIKTKPVIPVNQWFDACHQYKEWKGWKFTRTSSSKLSENIFYFCPDANVIEIHYYPYATGYIDVSKTKKEIRRRLRILFDVENDICIVEPSNKVRNKDTYIFPVQYYARLKQKPLDQDVLKVPEACSFYLLS